MSSNYRSVKSIADSYQAKIVVVSKNQSVENIVRIYDMGQREFAENRVQNLVKRTIELPKDVDWHMIGHLQSNKVNTLVPLVKMIQSVDSARLASQISNAAQKNGTSVDVLIQIKISRDETKSGILFEDLVASLESQEWNNQKNINFRGVMGISSLDGNNTRMEFRALRANFEYLRSTYFSKNHEFDIISMGMSSDYQIALEEGSNMIRLGSYVFEDL